MRTNVTASQFSTASQLSLSIAPTAPVKGAASCAGPLRQFARLTEAERAILRLKAFLGTATNKTDFMALIHATDIRASGGLAWSHKTLNPILDHLISIGLLKADQSCVESLRHPLQLR